jgi:hypothetical protein
LKAAIKLSMRARIAVSSFGKVAIYFDFYFITLFIK